MLVSQKMLCILAVAGFSASCTVVQPRYASPAPEKQVVETTTVETKTYYDAPAQPTYEPPPAEVAPVYENELAPYGRWIVYPRYGRCWVPNGVSYGWQPYTVGHWVYDDNNSCAWVSEDREVQWGGIVYHYGQWARTNDMGWIWVPGTSWAPAWVAWREGGGYCGWAPLPPEAVYNNQVTYVQADRYCPADRYVYVEERNFDGGRVDRRVVRNNVTVINNTKNITNITVVNNNVVNHGVASENIERISGRQVQRTKVVHYDTPAIDRVHNDVIQQGPSQKQLDQQKRAEDIHQAAVAHQQQAEAAKQAAREKAAEHAKDVAEQKRAAQAEHQKQVDAQRQAAKDRQADQRQKPQSGKNKPDANDNP